MRLTDEMIRRGAEAVHAMGGVPFNPHLGAETHSAAVREILAAALGVERASETEMAIRDTGGGTDMTEPVRLCRDCRWGRIMGAQWICGSPNTYERPASIDLVTGVETPAEKIPSSCRWHRQVKPAAISPIVTCGVEGRWFEPGTPVSVPAPAFVLAEKWKERNA